MSTLNSSAAAVICGNYVDMSQRSDTTTSGGQRSAAVRPYRATDHAAGRRLWTELTEDHQALYPPAGGARGGGDLGAAFEEYLARIDLSGMWVAERPEVGVVGLAGLIMHGRTGEVRPVVVSRDVRGQGIGRALLERVADEARRRGMAALTISPSSRNVAALRCLHGAGFDVLSAVELSLDLGGGSAGRRDGTDFQGLRFRY